MKLTRKLLAMAELPISLYHVTDSDVAEAELLNQDLFSPSDRPAMDGFVLICHEDEDPRSIGIEQANNSHINELFGIEDFLLTGIGFDELIISPRIKEEANGKRSSVLQWFEDAAVQTLLFDQLQSINRFLTGTALCNILNELEKVPQTLEKLDLAPENWNGLAEIHFGIDFNVIKDEMDTFDPPLPDDLFGSIVTQDGSIVVQNIDGEWVSYDYQDVIEAWAYENENSIEGGSEALIAERLAFFNQLKDQWHAANPKNSKSFRS